MNKGKKPATRKKSVDADNREKAAQAEAYKNAELALSPSLNAIAVVEEYGKPVGEMNLAALLDTLDESIVKVWDGDMKRCEAMLLGQAHALQAIFMNLSRKAARQDYLNQFDTYLRMALKAQSQCRATLETLAAIKNPPVTIVRQANIAHGPQQVNNGGNSSASPARAREIDNSQTQLLEADHGQRLDTGTAGAASGVDKKLEAVGAVNRPENA